MAKRKKLRARPMKIALWRRQVFWIWQQERQKRRAVVDVPPGTTLQADTGVDLLSDVGTPILVN